MVQIIKLVVMYFSPASYNLLFVTNSLILCFLTSIFVLFFGSIMKYHSHIKENDIVMCMGVGVTKITDSRPDDLIYSQLRFQSLLITVNVALSLIYTVYSSPLDTH
jgi:hypothetical protein